MSIYTIDNQFVDTSRETFLSRSSKRTQITYVITVLFILTFLGSMPFIKISLSVQGNGIIRPVSEKTEVKSLVSEIIEEVYVNEGQFIEKGSPILKLRTNHVDSRIQYLQYQEAEANSCIDDLRMLTGNTNDNLVFESSLYRQEYYYFKRQNEELQNKLEKSTREYQRNKKLYENGVIATKEYEDYLFQLKSAQNEIRINADNYISRWQSDLIKYKISLKEIKSNLEQVTKEKDFYLIRAPISGSIEQFTGIYRGGTLNAGETVVVISPDSKLISEIYVSPKDIGYLNKTNKVRIQVDAFNYNEWGILLGRIENISSDFVLINNIPMFRVRCTMDKNYLSLQNGFKGVLRKGMTVRARFNIAERSLFQILYQSADDWLNPTQFAVNADVGQ